MGRIVAWLALSLATLIAAAFLFAPREPLDPGVMFDADALPGDLDAWLAQEEARHPGIVPGTEKRIVWTGAAGARTPLSVVYLHGFSATSEEIRPVPEEVARALGANLFLTRLAGHGRGGAALGTATATDWVRDTKEAMAIGRRIGGRMIVIGTSTGGTLAAIAATDPAMARDLAGVVFVSPNFGVRSWAGALFAMPFVRVWGPWIVGPTISLEPVNAANATFWTMRYPIVSLLPVGALMRYAAGLDYGLARMPALFLYSLADRVVDPAATARVARVWGGPVRSWHPDLTDRDDPMRHVIAGRVLSPDQTRPVVAQILAWARTL